MTPEQLAETLNSGDDASRLAAVQTLAEADPATLGPAAPALVLAAGDPAVAELCAAVLEDLGAPPADCVPRLAELLSADAADTAYWAATLLGRLGENASSATPGLVALAENDRAALATRERAVWAIGKIGAGAAAARSALEPLAGCEHARLARLAKQAVVAIGG